MFNFKKILVSPQKKHSLEPTDRGFVDTKTKKKYQIKKGVPVLIDMETLPKHLQEQIKYFSKEFTANEYFLDEWQKSYVDRFLKQFPDVKGKLILDCGAGAGYMTVELAKRGAYVVATDLTIASLLLINQAAKKLNLTDKIYCVACDSQELPFADKVFDFYLSNAVLEHLPDDDKAIKEASRVSKNRSGVMITVPLLMKFTNPLLLLLNYYNDRKLGHLRRYDENTLLKKFKPYKYKITKNYYTGHLLKVIIVIAGIILHLNKGKQLAEKIDDKQSGYKWGANNIITFLKR